MTPLTLSRRYLSVHCTQAATRFWPVFVCQDAMAYCGYSQASRSNPPLLVAGSVLRHKVHVRLLDVGQAQLNHAQQCRVAGRPNPGNIIASQYTALCCQGMQELTLQEHGLHWHALNACARRITAANRTQQARMRRNDTRKLLNNDRSINYIIDINSDKDTDMDSKPVT